MFKQLKKMTDSEILEVAGGDEATADILKSARDMCIKKVTASLAFEGNLITLYVSSLHQWLKRQNKFFSILVGRLPAYKQGYYDGQRDATLILKGKDYA